MPDEPATQQPAAPDLSSVVADAASTAMAPPLPQNVWETNFDDESISGRDFASYKGRNKVTDRIGLLTPNRVLIARDHYKEGIGYVVCNSEFKVQGKVEVCTKMAPCCEHMDAPRKRITTLLIKYNTSPAGQLVNPFGYELLVWQFSPDKFQQLQNINKEFPLADHDILALCEEEKYQRMVFTACRQAIHKDERIRAAVGAQIDQWINAIWPKLTKAAGKKLTNQEILQKLGLAAGTPTVVAPTMEAPVADIADLLK